MLRLLMIAFHESAGSELLASENLKITAFFVDRLTLLFAACLQPACISLL